MTSPRFVAFADNDAMHSMMHIDRGETSRMINLGPLPGAPRSLVAGEMLSAVGDRSNWCWIVTSGVIEKAVIDRDGTRHVIAFYFKNDVCRNPWEPQRLDYEVIASTDAVVARIHVADVRRLSARDSDVKTAFEDAASAEMVALHRWIGRLGRSASRRIAALLQEIFVRLAAADMPTVLFGTQTTIAQATGLSLVHVNKSLKQLASHGCLRRDGRCIVLADPDCLEELADCDPPRVIQIHWQITWS